MPLQVQPLSVQFGSGLDLKSDPKSVAITKLLDCVNAVFTKTNSISKRNGYRALGQTIDGTAAPYKNAQGLATRGTELVLFANANSYSYRPTSDTWQTIGAVSSVVAAATALARTGTNQTVPDAATNHGITVLAWEDSNGGVWSAVVEAASDRILTPPTQLDASGKMPRCVAVGEVVHVLWVNGSNLWVAIVNPAVPSSFGTPQPLVIDLDPAVQGYDAVATLDSYNTASKPGCIAWVTPGGYRVGYIHPSGVLGSPVTGLPSAATFLLSSGAMGSAIGVAFSAGKVASVFTARIGVVYQSGIASSTGYLTGDLIDGTTIVRSSTTGLITPSFAQLWNRIAVEWDSNSLWWAAERNASTADVCSTQFGNLPIGTLVPSTAQTIRGHSLASRAWNDNGAVYVAVVHPVLYFPYVAIVQISAGGKAQSRLLPGQSSGQLTRPILPSVTPILPTPAPTTLTGPPSGFSRQHALPLGYRIQLSGSSGTQFGEQGIQLFSLDYNHQESYVTAQLGLGLYLSGSLIQNYDGMRWAESDFHCAPDTASGTFTATQAPGGSLTTTSSYVYELLYEEIDAQGELHPGPTSVGFLIALTGVNNQVTLTIPTYRLTSKLRVRIGVFRSLANATGTPTQIQYFRVSSVNPNATGANGYLLNDPTVDTVTFVDNFSDMQAKVSEPLYTNGGILGNDPTPAGGEIIANGKSRLFFVDPLDGTLVRYSQERREDVAAEMSPLLTQQIDPFGGAITAVAVMDDSIIVFKETCIFAFAGPGPAADGGLSTQAAFTPAQLLSSDVGCKSASSVCQMPLGIVFQSDKGICLLRRDLTVVRIGDAVYAYNSQTIVRATLLPDRPHVVFLTDNGWTLLFDYERGQWSKFGNHQGHDAVVVSGSYCYLRTDGRVFQETPGVYQDGSGQHIPMLIETAWIKLTGYLQGWQRILYASVIGTYISPHTLRVHFRLDYEPAYSQSIDANVNSVYTPNFYGAGAYGVGTYSGVVGVSSTVYQEEFHLNRRCQSISLRFEDVELAGNYGAGFELSELLLLGGVLGPKFQPGNARSQ